MINDSYPLGDHYSVPHDETLAAVEAFQTIIRSLQSSNDPLFKEITEAFPIMANFNLANNNGSSIESILNLKVIRQNLSNTIEKIQIESKPVWDSFLESKRMDIVWAVKNRLILDSAFNPSEKTAFQIAQYLLGIKKLEDSLGSSDDAFGVDRNSRLFIFKQTIKNSLLILTQKFRGLTPTGSLANDLSFNQKEKDVLSKLILSKGLYVLSHSPTMSIFSNGSGRHTGIHQLVVEKNTPEG